MVQNPTQRLEDTTFWQTHVDQFQAVKQSKTKYCKKHSLNYHRFLYWFDKLTKPRNSSANIPNLVPVHVTEPKISSQRSIIASYDFIY